MPSLAAITLLAFNVIVKPVAPSFREGRCRCPRLTAITSGATNIRMNSKERQLEIVRGTPLVSIDLVIEDGARRVLVGKRVNEPARGCWFVPGGRVLKDERLDHAFSRILLREVGWTGTRDKAEFIGVYEHFYPANFAGSPGVTTHYVALAYRLIVPDPPPIRADDQHEHLEWMSIPQLLADPGVHENTKVYYRQDVE